jgi:CheY-like chemotaxis protein
MLGNSQSARSKSGRVANILGMKTPLMLLFTSDNESEDSVAEALLELGGVSHLTSDAGQALNTVCGVPDLDLALIDFEHGSDGMTLLSAISILREDLPVIVVIRNGEKDVEALAYKKGARACFAKPVVVTRLVSAIRELLKPEPEVVSACRKA